MGKKRIIDSKIRKSQTFAKLTYRQRDLWIGLIAVADDQGRLPGKATYVRSTVWPYDDPPIEEVEADIEILSEIGNLICYEIDGLEYIQILNWWKYQQPQWAGPSDFPAPDGWVDRLRYHAKGGGIVTDKWDTPGGYCLIEQVDDNDIGSDLPSDLPSATVNVKVKDEVKEAKGNKLPPHNLDGWLDRVRESKNRNSTLLFMFNILYPDATETPDYGYLGKTARVVGGAGRLAALMWECSSKKITGDVMRYIQGYAKGNKDQVSLSDDLENKGYVRH